MQRSKSSETYRIQSLVRLSGLCSALTLSDHPGSIVSTIPGMEVMVIALPHPPESLLDSPDSTDHDLAMKSLIHLISTGILGTLLSACTLPKHPDRTPPSVKAPARSPDSAENPAHPKPASPKPQSAAIKEIDITRLFTLKTESKALIYDVRLPLYYKLGHIDGAILFYPKPFDEAFDREEPQMKKALSEGKVIVLYCGAADCHDSHIVAKMIAERGIPVSVYSGGWAEWKEVGIE